MSHETGTMEGSVDLKEAGAPGENARPRGENVQTHEFVNTGYDKNGVKVLVIRRDRSRHDIMELTADVEITLKSSRSYQYGDNSGVISTDTIKNTVHALAKLKEVKSIEQFSLDICQHFLTSYNHVLRAKVYMEEAPWRRLQENGVAHAHALIFSPEAHRFCDVEQNLKGAPVVHSGVKNMKLLKTTQSGFEGFLRDCFTTLKEAKDRCFCTAVYARWRYNKFRGVDFDAAWNRVKETVIEKFAGSYDHGEYSAAVPKTLYDSLVLVLDRVPEVDEIHMVLPNQHYFTIDMTKMGLTNQDEVLLPLDNPSGNITGTTCRKDCAKL